MGRRSILRATEAGFSFIEMSIVLMVIAIIISTIVNYSTTALVSAESNANDALMTVVQRGVRGYLTNHNRLPCPDADARDAAGDCVNRVGALPFAALGRTNGADRYGTEIRYGVFTHANGDLSRKGHDRSSLCSTLKTISNGTGYTTEIVNDNGQYMPYVLLSQGANLTAEGDNSTTNALNFVTPGTYPASLTTYDDVVRSDSFLSLWTLLACEMDVSTLLISADVPSGAKGSGYTATIEATGGNVSTANTYQWCIQVDGTATLPAGLIQSPSPALPVSLDCSAETFVAAASGWTLTSNGLTPSGSYRMQFFVKDDADEESSVSTILTVNP
ncbi:MAG: prepilin-type N-terminal cleavage/methylation domain-containing protein [Magnetococcales bacterium]|nr:prepilin-type N-terminal cleavage/methylation domain-containing protein [Magnetococcales bacterium]